MTGLQWFKIQEDGFNPSTGKWAVDTLIANKGKVSFTIPQCIASGQYLLRHELIGMFHPYLARVPTLIIGFLQHTRIPWCFVSINSVARRELLPWCPILYGVRPVTNHGRNRRKDTSDGQLPRSVPRYRPRYHAQHLLATCHELHNSRYVFPMSVATIFPSTPACSKLPLTDLF